MKNENSKLFCETCGCPRPDQKPFESPEISLEDFNDIESDAEVSVENSEDRIECPKCFYRNPKTREKCMNCGTTLRSAKSTSPGYLNLPNNKQVPFLNQKQSIGREDFRGLKLSKDDLLSISRIHFIFWFETIQGTDQLFIEDGEGCGGEGKGSLNNTIVKQKEIRGKGKIAVYPGDKIIVDHIDQYPIEVSK